MTLSPMMKKVEKARGTLINAHPFWGVLSLKLLLEECPDIETADVDGVTLRFNPKFIEGLTDAETVGLVGHEVAHCALCHIGRLVGRDMKRWNIAADEEANPILADARLTLPKGALMTPAYKGKHAEDIYALLPPPPPGSGGGSGQNGTSGPENAPGVDPGRCGGIRRAPDGTTPAQEKALKEDWEVSTIQAANAAKAAGKLPGSLERLVNQIKEHKVDWRELLRQFISATIPSDYRWTPSNRRYVASGLYLPSMVKENIGPIAVMIDTSGSIDQGALAAFAAELNGIVEDCEPESVSVAYFDTRVTKADTFTPDEYPVKLAAKGGGGTDFRPPFDWIEKQEIAPLCAIVLTDGCCDAFPTPPDYPVLWAITGGNKRSFPFGDRIDVPSK